VSSRDDRHGTHPARAFGVTGGGFAEGQVDPDEYKPEKNVGGFATGQEDLAEFPEDAKLGGFARGQESHKSTEEGTFATAEGEAEE
jgi:hypothetical protein